MGWLDTFLKTRKTITPFYTKFPWADHDASMRYVDIALAGEAIEEHYNFSEYDDIPWGKFSDTENRIYKAYLLRLESDNPPNMRGWIKKLEEDYYRKIL